MSKERLEISYVIEMVKRETVIAKGINNTRDNVNLPIDLVLVLIEQAERLHGTNHKMGYIDMYADCNRMVGSDSMKIHKLEQQNKRYREALEFYAARNNYKLEHFDPNLNDYMSTVDYDEGEKARKALESEK